MDEVTELIEKAKAEFKKSFDYDLDIDDGISIEPDGIDIGYDDFDISRIDDYKSNPIISSAEIEYDGRARYIKVYAHLTPGDL